MKSIIGLIFLLASYSSFGQSFTFSLPYAAHTSAGVFKADSTLLRTLWADSSLTIGSHSISWDGKDDYGVTVPSPGTVTFKVLYSNVSFTWDGVIGNTSASNTGAGVHRGYYTSMTGMAITGTTAYGCQGYGEAYSSIFKFNTSNPQVRQDIFSGRVSTLNTDFVCTDGTNVYWAGYNAYKKSNSFVHATKVSDNSQVSFGANGSVYTMTNIGAPKTYTSVIDTTLSTNSKPTGLAVGNNYLFVAHGGLNRLDVLKKDSGNRVQTLTYPNCRYLAISNDTLWMVTGTNTVGKYTIQSGGTLSSIVTSITSVSTPGAIAAKGDQVLIIDQANQVLRFFHSVTGSEGTQIGTNGGYTSSPDVTNSKFMFNDYRGNTFSFVSFAPDGSFWLGDPGNYRQLHFSAAKVFIETIMSQGQTYSTSVDPNNISRVYGNYLEFAVDYTQPLTGSTGWTLSKNWGINYTSNVTTKKLGYVTTLSNGRTYAYNYVGGIIQELTTSGLRTTGSIQGGAGVFVSINSDGSLIKYTGSSSIGQKVRLTKYPLTGFDGSGNPIWSTTGTLLAVTPAFPSDLSDPSARPGIVSPAGYNPITTSGKVIFYQPSVFYTANVSDSFTGHHLGFINLGDSVYKIQTQLTNLRSYNGPYPNPGTFEIGGNVNQFAGSNASVVDNYILTGWHGEGYHSGQANFYNLYKDNGLAVGQFGTSTFKETGNPNKYPLPGPYIAGNALSPQLVKDSTTGDLILVHGDESYSGGIHIVTISNLSSVTEISSVSSNISPVANAGADQAITLPLNSTTLTGSGTDADGTIVSYAWTKVSGPAVGTIASPASAVTNINSLTIAGTYVYRLTVTDNQGATNADLASVVVSPVHGTKINMGSGSGSIYFINAGSVQAGDTICVAAGTYDQISFDGLVGTSTAPITIINCGGVVTVTNNGLYCYRVVNSQYVHFTGTGSAAFYGFVATQPNISINAGSGMNFKQKTSDYEIDHFDSYNCENGFLCKIDPDDSTLNTYSNGWVIKNVSIHDNRVRRTQGEGLYIINTASTEIVKGFSGADTTVEPVKGRNGKYFNNIVDSTGWDGIQVAATDTLQIYNNQVSNYGWKNAGSQQGGILVGGKSSHAVVKNNKLDKGTGNGIQVFGYNIDTLANNILHKVGFDGTGTGQHGIFIDDRPVSGSYTGLGALILNNTVDSSGNYSIGIFNSNGTMGASKVYGNIFIQHQSKYFDIQGGAVVDTAYNLRLTNTAAALFTAPGNYHIQYTSPARAKVFVNSGLYNISKDYDNVTRSYPYAAGAYDFAGTTPLTPVVKDFFILFGKLIIR